MTKWMSCLGILVLTSAIMGCGPAQVGPTVATLADVGGSVQLDGKPMPEGEISFVVVGGGPNSLKVTDGKFSGKVAVGEQRVEIRMYRAGKPVMMDGKPSPGEPPQENYLPAKYSTGSTMKATIVAAGTKDLSFDVTSK